MAETVAQVFVWFNRNLDRGFPAYMSRDEINRVQVDVERRVKVCGRCRGDGIQMGGLPSREAAKRLSPFDWPGAGTGACPACDGAGKDRFLVLCESMRDGAATWYGNDEPLMRRVASDRGHLLDNIEIGFQRRHGVRVPPPPVPRPDYGFGPGPRI